MNKEQTWLLIVSILILRTSGNSVAGRKKIVSFEGSALEYLNPSLKNYNFYKKLQLPFIRRNTLKVKDA